MGLNHCRRLAVAAWIGTAGVSGVWAQDVKLTIGNPIAAGASPILKKGKAAFVVRLEGCSDPKPTLVGTAEGLIGTLAVPRDDGGIPETLRLVSGQYRLLAAVHDRIAALPPL